AEGSPTVGGLWKSRTAVKNQIDKKLDTESDPGNDPSSAPKGWELMDNYRDHEIWLWKTSGEDWGFWFDHDGESYGPYIKSQECRDKVDAVLNPSEPEPDPTSPPVPIPDIDIGIDPNPNIVQIIVGFTITVLGLFMQFGAGLGKSLGSLPKGGVV
ncbi:hypothetical protein LCGC14_2554930, partial [marine sediment metagenome]